MKTLFFYIFICAAVMTQRLEAQGITTTKNSSYTFLKQKHDLASLSSFDLVKGKTLKPVGENLYTQHLGFFCRQEIKMEQQIKVPLKIRLGSTDYCNWLEGKAGCGMPAK